MNIGGSKTFSAIILVSCVAAPPLIMAFLWPIATIVCDAPWEAHAAAAIVAAWTIAAAYATRNTWRTGIGCALRRGFRAAYITHAIVLIFACTLMDHGELIVGGSVASILYWMTATIIIARRPQSPTEVDISWVSRGFLLLACGVTAFYYAVHSARGY